MFELAPPTLRADAAFAAALCAVDPVGLGGVALRASAEALQTWVAEHSGDADGNNAEQGRTPDSSGRTGRRRGGLLCSQRQLPVELHLRELAAQGGDVHG